MGPMMETVDPRSNCTTMVLKRYVSGYCQRHRFEVRALEGVEILYVRGAPWTLDRVSGGVAPMDLFAFREPLVQEM
jgi:hypothetical protein